MRVYAVLYGEKYEAWNLRSIHKTEAGAVKSALEIETHFEGGWEPDPDDSFIWANGCDCVMVVRKELEK